jgi:hypothetical protein
MIAAIELSMSPPSDGRQEDRAPVQIPVALRTQGCNAFNADVSDLSRHGFRVETHIPIAVDSYIWLRLPGLSPLAARVAWTAGLTHGCRFVDPLHPAVAERVIAAHRAA